MNTQIKTFQSLKDLRSDHSGILFTTDDFISEERLINHTKETRGSLYDFNRKKAYSKGRLVKIKSWQIPSID